MKIIISNIVTLNMGDAAILRGEIKILKKVFGPHTEFVIYDSQPEISKKYYPDLNFRKMIFLTLPLSLRRIPYLGNFLVYISILFYCIAALMLRFNMEFLAKLLAPQAVLNALNDYRSSDLVVSTGGTILVENYDLKPRWFDFFLTLILDRPLVLFTQSLGPFRKPANKFLAKLIFNRAVLIFLRDARSKKHLIDIGIKSSKMFVCADAAFAFVDPKSLLERMRRPFNFAENIKIAISVREWSHFKKIDPAMGRRRYIESIKDLCAFLTTSFKAHITFLSTCQGIPEYWTDDAKFAAEIINSLPDDVRSHVDLNSEFHNPQEMIELLKKYDVTLSTRLHMGILSFCAGTPSMLIAYEFKSKELFKRLNLSNFSLDIEDLDSEKLIESINLFIQSLPTIRSNLFSSIEKEHSKAFLAAKIMKPIFLSDPSLL